MRPDLPATTLTWPRLLIAGGAAALTAAVTIVMVAPVADVVCLAGDTVLIVLIARVRVGTAWLYLGIAGLCGALLAAGLMTTDLAPHRIESAAVRCPAAGHPSSPPRASRTGPGRRLRLHKTAQQRACTTPPSRGVPAAAARAIAFALAQRGKPYRWGSAGPDSFDCSGLTMRAYATAGITLPRTSSQQWASIPHIRPGQERAGDLVFFNSGPGSSVGHPGHVGLVLGGGQMVVAPHSGAVVQLQSYRGRADLVGFGRPTGSPRHHPPAPAVPSGRPSVEGEER